MLRDAEALAERGSLLVARGLRRALRARGAATLVLAGGATPLALYRRLASPPLARRIRWSSIEILWGDERCVPPGDPASNFGAAKRALLERLPRPPRAVHRIAGEHGAQAAAERLRALLAERLAGGGRLDLVLLGLGADGHSASLFPGADWDDRALVVTGRAPGSACDRVSLGPAALGRARTLLLLASGAEKADAVARLAAGHALPAARLRPGRLVWLLDAAAAARLRSRAAADR